MTTKAPLLTVQDVANRLNVPVSWVYAQAEAGKLAHLKLGKYVRFEERVIDAYVERARDAYVQRADTSE